MGGVSSVHANTGQGLNGVQAIEAEASFRFDCHPGISCFTECCRELELALSPYDVIRLRRSLAIGAQDFLDQYAIVEFSPDDDYPKVYLAMIDDGRASCPMVEASGCRVYQDRPAACRTYPVGRGTSFDHQGQVREQFLMVTEAHCQGFSEEREQTVTEWQSDQELTEYNRMNDLLLPLLTRGAGLQGLRLTTAQADLFIDTLYHLDLFRFQQQASGTVPLPDDEAALIPFAVTWLTEQWLAAR